MERTWRDVRKGTIEFYIQIFRYLKESQLLNMRHLVHRLCLILVFMPRIQRSLNETIHAWNHHQIRTEHYQTPITLFELSRQQGIRQGWWEYDPGDSMDAAGDPLYGVDGEAPHPPMDDLRRDHEPEADVVEDAYPDTTPELEDARQYLSSRIDLDGDDDNHGIDIYLDAVHLLYTQMPDSSEEETEDEEVRSEGDEEEETGEGGSVA